MLYLSQFCSRGAIKLAITTPRIFSKYFPSFATIKIRNQNDSNLQSHELLGCSYQNESMLKEYLQGNVDRTILMYPYRYIPLSLIYAYGQLQQNNEQVKDLIAFRCLSNIRQQELRQAMGILLPSINKMRTINTTKFEGGRQIFTDYFSRKNQALKQAYKKGSVEQKLKYLVILNNYMLNNSTTELAKQINEKWLMKWDQTGLGLAYYVQILIKNHLPWKHLIRKIMKKLTDTSIPDPQKARVGIALLSLPKFYKSYPAQLSDLIFSVITNQIQQMSNYELLQILRFGYQYTSSESINFCTKLLTLIQSINPSLNPQRADFLIQMILKTFKYASVLKLDLDVTLTTLLNKNNEFQPLFKQISCIHFHTLLFLWHNQSSLNEVLAQTKQHILKGIKYYSSLTVISDQQLKKLFQLILKYWKKLTSQEKHVIKVQTIKIMKGLQSQVLIIFECLQILLQQYDQFLYTEEVKPLVTRALKKFFERTCRRNSIGHLQIKSNIEQNIFLINLITKNKLVFIQSLPQVENYTFDYVNLISLNCLEKLIEYLKNVETMKVQDLHNIFNKIQPIMIYYINKKRMSFRTTLSILQLCTKGKYERKVLYGRIQKSIYQIMRKFPNFVITSSDLHLIKEHMINQNQGSISLQEMVDEALEDPNNWTQIRRKFVDNEEQYWNRFDERQKERSEY